MDLQGKRLSEKKWLDDEEKLQRLSVMVLREVDRIVFDLEFHRDMLIKLWSKERIRMPLLRVMHSRYFELSFELLALFPPRIYQLLDDFYRALDSFIFYVSYTEDMPQALMLRFDTFFQDLKERSGTVLELLKACAPKDEVVRLASEGPPPLVFEGEADDMVFEDTDPGKVIEGLTEVTGQNAKKDDPNP